MYGLWYVLYVWTLVLVSMYNTCIMHIHACTCTCIYYTVYACTVYIYYIQSCNVYTSKHYMKCFLFLSPHFPSLFLSLPLSLSPSLSHRMNNITEFSGMFEGSGFPDNGTEFNCLSSNVSSSDITNKSFWKITLREGAPAVATVIGIYFLVALSWNFFIIVTFLRKRKLLREPANILLLNLAVADLMVALTQMFFSMVTEAAAVFTYGTSDVVRCGVCDFVGVFFMLLYGVSIHTLAAISFDRFLLLYKPFHYKKYMSRRNTLVLVGVVWLIAALIALPPVLGFGQIEFNQRFGSCVPRFGGMNLMSGIMNFVYVAYVALESLFPIATIVVCSFWTYRFVNQFLRKNYRRRSFYNRRGSDGVVQQRQEDTRYHHQQQQLVKVFGALLVSNVVSWLPVLIVVIAIGILGSPERVPDWVYIVGWICFLSAPVFHPIIESFFVKDMRLVVCKGIRKVNRASSFIARSTTGMFTNKDIELANEKAEDDEYVSKRKIAFFDNKRNRITSTISMTTEVTDVPMPSYHDNSPSPKVSQKQWSKNRVATTTTTSTSADIVLRDKSNETSSAAKPARRITFSDQSPPNAPPPDPAGESPMTRNGVRKSALRSQRPNDGNHLTPLGELEIEDSNSSADGSVFNSPDSPRHDDTLLGLIPATDDDDKPEEGDATEDNGDLKSSVLSGVRNGIPGTEPPNSNSREEKGSNSNEDSNMKLLETVYSERRGSWTLV